MVTHVLICVLFICVVSSGAMYRLVDVVTMLLLNQVDRTLGDANSITVMQPSGCDTVLQCEIICKHRLSVIIPKNRIKRWFLYTI